MYTPKYGEKNVKGFWDKFIYGFCKVEFLCWQGDPNWLGWAVIGMAVFILIMLVFAMISILD